MKIPSLLILWLTFCMLACANIRVEVSPPRTVNPTSTHPVIPVANPTQPLTILLQPTANPINTPKVLTLYPKEFVLPTATPIPTQPQPVLAFNEHISAQGSFTETQWATSGPMICQIKRDSCAYYQMVGNLDPTIVFKREEEPPYNTEDILMHPAILLPLSRLNQLVLAEWDGAYLLRITDAYDSLLEHDLSQPDPNRKYSLHFEGRAIDVTTWPVDSSQYGRLCMLAHEAGFTWVHNEGTHCHASIKARSLCEGCGE